VRLRCAREWVPLSELVGRRLSEPVRTRVALPHATAAAADGWALRSSATPGTLKVIAESAAGRPYRGTLGRDEAVRITSGALLPDAADAVLRREDGREHGGMLAAAFVRLGWEIRLAGDEFPRAAEVLPDGHRIRAHDLGLIATCGWDGAFCVRRPRVAIVAIGDELVAPGQVPDEASVVDSNRFAIGAAAIAAGAELAWMRAVPRTADAMLSAVADAITPAPHNVDLLVTTGGASAGEHGHVRSVLRSVGADVVFSGIAMRPGRPTALANIGDTRILVLAGFPGAAVIGFHLIGRELLGGGDWAPAVLGAPYRGGSPHDEFVWCAMTDAGLVPSQRQGGGSLAGLAEADALLWIRPGDPPRPPGGHVLASMLP